MKPMRNIKELLQLMLDNKQHFATGLCFWTNNLYYNHIISKDEYIVIENYMGKKLPPKKQNKFCWKIGNIKPRLKWIEKHIKLNS